MQTGLLCFQIAAAMNQQDVDLQAVCREFGLTSEEVDRAELIRIIQKSGFKCKTKTDKLAKLVTKYPMPIIVQKKDLTYAIILQKRTKEAQADSTSNLELTLGENKPNDTTAKTKDQTETLIVWLPPQKTPIEMSIEDVEEQSNGNYLIMAPSFMSNQAKFGFVWFYTEIMKFKQVIMEVMLGSFIVQAFGLVTPLLTQVILDKVIVHRTLTTLDVLAIAFLAVTGFEFLINLTRNYIFIHTANKIDAKLGAKLFKHLFSLPYVYFESRRVGNIVARIRELDNIREFITSKSVSVIIDLFFSLVFVVMMFCYSVQLTFIVLAFVAIVATIYASVTPVLRKRLDHKFQMAAQSNSYLVESITGIQTVKSLAIEGTLQRKWEDTLGQYLNSSFRLSNLGTVAGAISNFFQRMMTIAILYLGVRLVIENKLTIGQLIAFQMFAGQFTNPVLRLVNLWNEFQQTLLAVDRLGDILNHPIEVKTSKDITLERLQGSIKFDEVSFRYTGSGPLVLNKVSLDVKTGQSIGIVGRSGSGKSTLAKLVQRLYIPQEGAIYVDGIDVRHLNPNWLRQNIGVVLQENYLFSGTIRDNIAMPKPEASMAEIIACAQMAGAHEFISQLPEGYDTFVGERGSSLSGGQKQRIAIARALISNPRILIFDEATSALDYESETIINQNMAKIKVGRTVLIIAHRLTTVKDCDIIVAMDKGEIVEQDSHDNLLASGGYYFNLHNHQMVGSNASTV